MGEKGKTTPKCCNGCHYWRPLDGATGARCCHYMLDTHHRCGRVGDVCPSHKARQRKKKQEG